MLERVFGNGVVLTRDEVDAGAIDLRHGRVVVVVREPAHGADFSGDGPDRRPPGHRVGG